MQTKKTKKTQDFEHAMSDLENIVQDLENGDLGLDKSLESFEKGMSLAKFCEGKLNEATGKVEKIMKDFSDGEKIVALREEELEN
jgi:exodeoxyribonuclease VII small subunit